jgi:HK97 gp10 family phage protein
VPVRFHLTIDRNRVAAARAAIKQAAEQAREDEGKELRDDTVKRAPKGTTHHLEESWKTEKQGDTVWVYSDPAIAPYAKFVENGTSKMAAEPHFGPAIHAARRRYPGRVSRAIKARAADFGG